VVAQKIAEKIFTRALRVCGMQNEFWAVKFGKLSQPPTR
jgi:hypothetical protein